MRIFYICMQLVCLIVLYVTLVLMVLGTIEFNLQTLLFLFTVEAIISTIELVSRLVNRK